MPGPELVRLSPQEERARRRRSVAMGLALGALVILFFIITLVRLGGAGVMSPNHLM